VSAVAALLSTPLAAWSDRLGRKRLLVGGYVAYAVAYFALGQIGSAGPVLWLLCALYGVFAAATEGVEKALVADLAPPGREGTAFGWFNLVVGAMLLPASWVFGWLYESVSAQAAFTVAAGCAATAALLLVGWVRAR
jgi:MFS family permease